MAAHVIPNFEPGFEWPFSPMVRAFRACFDDGAVFADVTGAVAWKNDADAVDEAEEAGSSCYGATPEVVAFIDDRAFIVELNQKQKLLPPLLEACFKVFEPGEPTVEKFLKAAQYPEGYPQARHAFRYVSRVSGDVVRSSAGRPSIAASMSSFEDEGAVVEPILDSVVSLSGAWRIDDDKLTWLGSARRHLSGGQPCCELVVAEDGVHALYGRRETVWHRQLAEDSFFAAEACAAVGYRGALDVQAEVYEGHGPARLRLTRVIPGFSAAVVAVALAARAPVGTMLRFQPDERTVFRLAGDTPV